MATTNAAPAPLRDLVDESCDEAIFLWGRWNAELASLTRSLDEVYAWTEDRLHGALDGVRVAGTEMITTAQAGLASDDVHHVAVSAGLLASSADSQSIAVLTAALRDAPPDRLRAAARGLELLGSHKALKAAAGVLRAGGAAHRAILSQLKAFHRSPPRDELTDAFASDAADWQCHALRSARLLPGDDLRPWVARGLEHADPGVRRAAIETGLTRGLTEAWRSAVAAGSTRRVTAAPYLRLLAMFGGPAEHEIVFDALRVPELQQDAVWALGHIGTRRAAEVCVAGMRHETLARAAGEAYCWITGADLVRDRLTRPQPDIPAPEFEDDDLDANLVPSADAAWPLPDPEAAARDWAHRQHALAADARHVAGRPATPAFLGAAVETGPMLRRPDLIVELAARTRGGYDVEPRAFAARQRHMMLQARGALASIPVH